jgi:hypothetical protein
MYTVPVPYGLTGLVLDPAQNPKHFVQKFGHLFNFGFLPSTIFFKLGGSVADPECLSRILDPDFYPSWISDPRSPISDPRSRISDPGSRIQKQQQKRGVKKICCHTFLCTHKFHKIEHFFSFEVLEKNLWANIQRIIELFTQKIVTKLSKIWVWDSGFGIRDPEKTYSGPGPGIKKAPDPGSGSATLQGGQTLEQCPQLQPHHMFWLLLRSSEIYTKVRPLYRFKKN